MKSIGNGDELLLGAIQFLFGFGHPDVSDHQVIHLGIHEASIGIVGCAYDRLAPYVERGVDQDRAVRQRFEGFEQLMQFRVAGVVNGLDPGGIIHMGDRGQFGSFGM